MADLVTLTGQSERTIRRRCARWLVDGWPKVSVVPLEAGGREYRVDRQSLKLYTQGVYEDPQKDKSVRPEMQSADPSAYVNGVHAGPSRKRRRDEAFLPDMVRDQDEKTRARLVTELIRANASKR